MFLKRVSRGAMLAPLAVALAACSEAITEPITAVSGGSFQLNGVVLASPEVAICKRGGEEGKPYPFTLSATGGSGITLPLGTSFNVPSTESNCFVMFFPGTGTTTLTLTEVGNMPSMIVLEREGLISGLDTITGTNTVTFDASVEQVVYVYVHNDVVAPPPPPPPPPVPALEGCTPGYWKQRQHFGNWESPYSRTSRFNTVFDVRMFSSHTTLLDALNEGGGGKDRLGRHATAALLNAASEDVNYGMTKSQVIAAVKNAARTGRYDAAADVFERLNEKRCTLGRADVPHWDKDWYKDRDKDREKKRHHKDRKYDWNDRDRDNNWTHWGRYNDWTPFGRGNDRDNDRDKDRDNDRGRDRR